MANYINTNSRTFGYCSACQSNQFGLPFTHAAITELEGGLAVRVGDLVIADCGHLGIITTGSTIVNIEGKMAATSNSLFIGDYLGWFITGISTITE